MGILHVKINNVNVMKWLWRFKSLNFVLNHVSQVERDEVDIRLIECQRLDWMAKMQRCDVE